MSNYNFKHIMSFQIFEKRYSPVKDDYVKVLDGETGKPVPVKILKVYPNNSYLVSYDVEGSTSYGKGTGTIYNYQIFSPYKPIKSPVGTGYVSANTNMSIRQVHQVSNDMYL